MKILSVVGARPNFVKLASIHHAVEKFNQKNEENSAFNKIENIIVHTGQHYDLQMSKQFFNDFDIPKPKVNLEVGSGSHAVQTAEIMKRFEPVLLKEAPDILLVVGDVNSTIACTLVASKIKYPSNYDKIRPIIVHVEAGLRSFDQTMPEEINRILTDSLSNLLFVTEEQAISNLKNEGISQEKIIFVGNVMIDTLNRNMKKVRDSLIKKELEIEDKYCLVTLHRPSNVDDPVRLKMLIECLKNISKEIQIVFALHPRTRNNLKNFNFFDKIVNDKRFKLTVPLKYLDFLNLTKDATFVMTDSGGIQEETTFLGIPCVTLRENTERPVTITEGSNYLVGKDPEKIITTVNMILSGKGKVSQIPKLWDGRAGERIVAKLFETWDKSI